MSECGKKWFHHLESRLRARLARRCCRTKVLKRTAAPLDSLMVRENLASIITVGGHFKRRSLSYDVWKYHSKLDSPKSWDLGDVVD